MVCLGLLLTELSDEIDEIYKKAQYNKKTCETMLERVQIANTVVKNLKIRNLEFFSKKNFINFRNLVTVISEIRQFLVEISQSKGSYRKYVQAKDVQEKFSSLNDEFETAIRLLQFFLIINFNARVDDDKKIKADIEEVSFNSNFFQFLSFLSFLLKITSTCLFKN